MPNLDTLPIDLLLEITSHLDYGSIVFLSTTSRALHAFLDPDAVVTLSDKQAFYHRAERFPQHANNLACFHCWRLKPLTDFGNAQSRGHRGKHSLHPNLARTRFCWDCGAAKRLYGADAPVRRGRFLWYLCHKCGQYRLGSERCEMSILRDPQTKEVLRCTVKCAPPRIPAQPSRFEEVLRAVPAAQAQVLSLLCYRDRIMLRQANRHFYETVDPLQAPLRDKARFVSARQVAITRGREAGTVSGPATAACFACFTVLPRGKFTVRQLARGRGKAALRAGLTRCQRCLGRLQGVGGPDEARRAREEWGRRGTCVGCKEVRYRDEECDRCFIREAEQSEKREERRRRKDMWEIQRAGEKALRGLVPWLREVEALVEEEEEGKEEYGTAGERSRGSNSQGNNGANNSEDGSRIQTPEAGLHRHMRSAVRTRARREGGNPGVLEMLRMRLRGLIRGRSG